MTTPMIDVVDLTVGWGDKRLLENASFRVERGDVFAVLGGSGSGKSTLLRFLTGLEQPLSGRIHVS